VIRQVETADWERLRDARLRALTDAPEAFLETLANAEVFPDERWQDRATPTDKQATFVVEREGVFDGMATGFVADDPATVYLVGMWVEPELRGTGTAGELVARVVDWARACGSDRVLLSVERDNGRAARLYEKCGFVELAEMPPLPYEPNPGNRFYAFEL
jgi:ribosomal protein S18 acetylase RimI-like enzyme